MDPRNFPLDRGPVDRVPRSGGGALVYLAVLATIGLLVLARDLLIPFAVALMVWVLIRALADGIGRLPGAGPRIPAWARYSGALTVIGLSGWFLLRLVVRNVARVEGQVPVYRDNLDARLAQLAARFGLADTAELTASLRDLDVMGLAGRIAGELGALAGSVGMVVIYLLFLLVEQRHFGPKLAALFPAGERRAEVAAMIDRARRQIESYVAIKFAASALTGAASWAVLAYLGVDLAAFWGLVIFLLNFIPTLGSIFGVALPLALILVQFPEPVKPFVIALVALIAIQTIIGNVLEPRWTSGSLDLSPLALILSLSAWGLMWGTVGMFLSVPLTVIIAIGCAQFPRTRWIAVLLSEKGAPAGTPRIRT